jgi:two-component system, cell cycle sensor histidine kinase and response regulator CckA
MQKVNEREIVRLAPRTARDVRDEIIFFQSVMQTVVRDDYLSPDVRDKITMISMMAGNVAQLARQFLIIIGAHDDSLAVFDVRDTISDLTSLFECLLGKNNRLQLLLDDDLWPIQGDAQKICDMLVPLVVNAREAMPRGGTLCVRARNVTKAQCKIESRGAGFDAEYVLVEIADEGIGIPKEIMCRLFEPFATTKGAGCGFSLAKVRHTVGSLNGHILCQSEAECGTTFKIFLPRHHPAPLE